MTTHDIAIVPGRPGDYEPLARFHYRAGRPAACVRILSAVDQHTGELVGVLTISMPILNAPWRARAWPRLFTSGQKRTAARQVNTNLRTISRVIIDPRYRALGIARRLVESYLASPLTPCTEAFAAMGRWCPFFARAGMREVPSNPPKRDRPLAAAIASLSLEPWELIDRGRAASAICASPRLRDALFSWAAGGRSTRRLLLNTESPEELFTTLAVQAASSLTAKPVIYVADKHWESAAQPA